MSIGFGDSLVGSLGVSPAAQESLTYCAQQVREHDPERYLATLFAPAEAREALFALYAFDHEIARVRHVVSEPMAGMVRFQWWREALEGIEARAPRAHPVVHGLVAAGRRAGLSRARLAAAIDAREAELAGEPPADLAALERRLAAACGGITVAATEVLGDAHGRAHEAALRVGLALGVVRLLQSLPRDLARNRVLVPVAMLVGHGIDPQHLQGGAGLRPVVADLAARACEHLREARRRRRAVPSRAIPALLHARLLDADLSRLERAGYDPFAAVRTRPAALAPLELLCRRALGRY